MNKDDAVKPARNDVTPQPLAIIGIGCLFPKSDNVSAYWSTVKNGVDAISEVPPTHWKVADYHADDGKAPDRTYGTRGGFIAPVDFNPLEYGLPPNVLEATDTSQILGMVAAGEALKDAGYGPDRTWDRTKVSVILGVTGTLELVIPLGARLGHPIWRKALAEAGVDDATADDVVQRISESYVPWQENSFPGLLGNVVAGRISKQFDLGGTNCVVDAACASSLGALHMAGLELAAGRSDMVVTGGVDTFNDIFMYMCFTKTPALSPTGNARPFDRKGDGTILGEGLGMVVLKRLADAERDGDRIYAVIRGIGSSSDGKGDAIYAPSAVGQQKALRAAYTQAGISPETIGMVEAHGTGTKVGDAVEVSALREVFGEVEKPWCAIGSVKSQIGHTKAAAGAAGLIKAALALHNKVLPPTIKVEAPLEEVTSGSTPFYVNTEKRPWMKNAAHPRRAGVSAFGFGGSNFHCILEEYRPEKQEADWDGNVQIVALSAATRSELASRLERMATAPWSTVRQAASESRAAFDPTLECRLLLVVEKEGTGVGTVVKNAKSLLADDTRSSWSTPDGAFFSCGTDAGKLAMLFPGQGAQYTGMLRDLSCQFPEMMETLEAAESTYTQGAGKSLADRVYPPHPFSAPAQEAAEAALRDTATAQPAIGAVSLGAAKVMGTFGVVPDAVGGHSYGELTALCAAGCISEQAFHLVSGVRGRLMGDGPGEKGTMLAVAAPLGTVETLIAENSLDLVIANRNAPDQAVLSGSTAEIARAAEACRQRSLVCKELPVAAAFHSPLVSDASVPFRAALDTVEFSSGMVPVYANTTAEPYPAEPPAARELLANQLARPVEFVSQIENMYATGCRTFLEVGPGARLTGLVKAILGQRPHTAVALDASNGRRPGITDLARALAQVAALGYGVNLRAWDAGYEAPAAPARKPAMTVPICGANYVKPRLPRPPVERSKAAPAAPSVIVTPPQAQAAAPASPPPASPGIAEALRANRETIETLQKLHEQTAALHRHFLQGQEAAGKTLAALLEQQQRLAGGAPAALPAAAAFPSPPAVASPVTAPAAAQAPPVESLPAHAPVSPATTVAPGRAEQVLLDVIAERTGYPVEMLELDMALDADLGIDSIKRVEILSALQERLPEAPAVKPEHLGTLQTLRQIVAHLEAGPSSVSASEGPVPPAAPPAGETEAVLLQVIAERTGYPVEMLELDMALDADLGIDSIKRVEILSALQERLPDAPIVKPEHLGTLQTLRQIVGHLSAGSTATVAPTQPVTQAPAADPGKTERVLLQVISDRTGYPVDMLELDMALDADLGIDSIKRVEILSALQEALPEAPVVKPEHLGTLQTLRQIVDHLNAGAHHAAPAPQGQGTTAAATDPARTEQVLLEVISDRTGYPVDMLELDMALDADLGIDSIKRVEILSALQERLPEAPVVKPEHLGTLQTLRQIVAHLNQGAAHHQAPATSVVEPPAQAGPSAGNEGIERSALTISPLDTTVRRTHLAVPVGTEILITSDDSGLPEKVAELLQSHGYRPRIVDPADPGPVVSGSRLGGLLVIAPEAGIGNGFFPTVFGILQQCSSALKASGAEGGATFVTVSRLDGRFGLGDSGVLGDPLSGGLAGLAKTAHREWPDVHCKALDLAAGLPDDVAAAAIVEEMFLSGPREVGITATDRFVPELVPAPLPPVPSDPGETAGTVVISGGGRGVTAEIAVAIARRYRSGLLLLGRSPEPAPEPAWLAPLSEEGKIKKALLEKFGTMSPKQLEEKFRTTMANREILRTVELVERAGSRVIYRSLDIRDREAVRQAVDDARDRLGPVSGLIHGAGVLADRRIEDKTAEQFDQVCGTKVEGLNALLAAVEQDELEFMALFSSSTGRFGRIGQSDYAVANEILNKIAQQQSRLRPGCRVISINWGPWDGGMVNPSLKKMFVAEGVGIIGLTAGADHLLREIAEPPGSPVESVVIGAVAREEVPLPAKPTAVLTPAVQLELSVERYPFLASHVMNGKAVLPMAMIAEWMGHGALHNNPGFRLHGFNDLRILKGVVFEREKPCTIRILTGKARKRDAYHTVPVEMVSDAEGREIVHARAEILLATKLPEGIRSITEVPEKSYPLQDGEFYTQGILFHGPDLQGIVQVETCSPEGIVATVKSAPPPAQWIADPLRNSWLTDPLAMDCAFQLMILWSFERSGKASLPCFAARYRQFQDAFPADGVQIVIHVTRENDQSATADMEFFDRATGKLVARLEGYECVIDASLNSAFRRNRLSTQGRVELGAA